MEQSMSRIGHCIDNGSTEGRALLKLKWFKYLEVRNEAFHSEIIQKYPIPMNKRIEKYNENWCI